MRIHPEVANTKPAWTPAPDQVEGRLFTGVTGREKDTGPRSGRGQALRRCDGVRGNRQTPTLDQVQGRLFANATERPRENSYQLVAAATG